MPAKLLDRGALVASGVLTGVWTTLVLVRPGWTWSSDGFPFSWRWHAGGAHRRYDLLALDIVFWLALFYALVAGFALMRRSLFRRPFDRDQVDPRADPPVRPGMMMLVLKDDGCVHVYPSPDDVSLAIEGLDAEDTLRAVFDDTGQRYAIAWLKPNREGLLGLENGVYRLVPSGAPDVPALLQMLSSAPVFPEKHRTAVEELRRRLGKG